MVIKLISYILIGSLTMHMGTDANMGTGILLMLDVICPLNLLVDMLIQVPLVVSIR